jgi:hypothetical protein
MCVEVRAPRKGKSHAHVAELVDALVSGTSIGNDVEVRVLSCALSLEKFWENSQNP